MYETSLIVKLWHSLHVFVVCKLFDKSICEEEKIRYRIKTGDEYGKDLDIRSIFKWLWLIWFGAILIIGAIKIFGPIFEHSGNQPTASPNLPQLTPDPTKEAPKPPELKPKLPPTHDPKASARTRLLITLKKEAESWLSRSSPEFHDFSAVLAAVSNDAHLDEDEIAERDTLIAASNLLKWKDIGLNAGSKGKLPIYIVQTNTDDVAGSTSHPLKELFKTDGFNIVETYSDAALYIEILDAYVIPAYENGVYKAVTSYVVKATWVGGGKPLIYERIEKSRLSSGLSFKVEESRQHSAIKLSSEAALNAAFEIFTNRTRR